MKKIIYLIDEFCISSSSPNSKHVKDIIDFINLDKKNSSKNIFFSKNYVPGGLRPKRLFNLLKSFIYMSFFIPYISLKELNIHKSIVITTSPPMLYLYCLFLCKFSKIDCYVWFMDAHPEIEARFLQTKGFNFIARFLRYIEKKLCNNSKKIICLDESMKKRICSNNVNLDNVIVCPPWATYLGSSNFIQKVDIHLTVKFIYAGNYGKVHDLSPMSDLFSKFTLKEQSSLYLTFVGMSHKSQLEINNIFSKLGCTIEFLPRFERVDNLIHLFKEYHFGIVSLSYESIGLACPSKAYTYISQGLPIYYVGPDFTLSHDLCNQGFGVSQTDIPNIFSDWIHNLKNYYSSNSGKIFHNPKHESLRKFKNILDERI
ncbi:hypothetical protein [Fluviispira sanaruensis]|uniref:Glycosyl transferase family 1 domain-containing protein n=1 Tax=Fluviispira sanaruensis TaxID=2493639 RepID=A0A4P2VL30_FLUSA|nr:hypothetical protein [Fluviispira sanaruensis]BBH54043.1 hypothetical protein JCM31447_25000 [Fluviispira sanaruensis]